MVRQALVSSDFPDENLAVTLPFIPSPQHSMSPPQRTRDGGGRGDIGPGAISVRCHMRRAGCHMAPSSESGHQWIRPEVRLTQRRLVRDAIVTSRI